MKRRVSLLLVLAMLLSMVPFAVSAAEATTLISVTDEAVTANGYAYTFHAETTGTLNVTMGTCSPGWQYVVTGPNFDSGNRGKFSAGNSCDYDVTAAGDWTVTVYAYTSSEGHTAGTVSFTLSFTPDEEGAEVQKAEYEVADTALVLGDNALTLLDTAETTIYVFEPAETAVYTFTAPEGATLGYWGAGSWYLSNPNSTSNTYEWTCTGVGQKAYMGVSGVNGEFTLTIAKTGEYEVVETPIVKYENKAELNAFTVPEGAILGAYVDVYGDTHTAVLGDDGYYHLDSVDGDVLLVDMDYQDIILSAALKSDRPVMYAYTTDADGNKIKYDIGDAVLEYEAVMDANGYYPLTEDLILFYDTYAVGAGTYTFYLTGDYNEDCVWMYCMRTMKLAEVEEPTEPSVPESSEPETEPSEPSVPESSEPEVEPSEPVSGTVVLNEAVTAAVASKYVYTYQPAEDGTLTITVGDGSTTWSSDLVYFQGVTMNTVATANGSAAATYSAEVTANTSYRVRVWNNSGALAATPLTVVFTPVGGTTPEPSEPETEPSEPSVPESSEPETEPSEPETEPSEPETEPSTPVVPEENVPAGTYYSITVDGNTTYYSSSAAATLNAALKKITGTGYVKFYQDMTLGSSYTVDVYNGDITIDLNGCTISSAYKAAGALYVSGGNVTLVDTSAEADGMFENTSTNGFGIEIYSGAVTMLSGSVKGYMGTKVWATATFNLKGGTVTGSQYGVNALADSTVNVSGGTVEQLPAGSLKYAFYANSAATVSVTGGNFNGTVSGSGLSGKISGGYFTKTVNANYIANGCEMQDNDDPVYVYKVVDPNAATEPEVPTEPTEPAKDAYAVSTTTLSVGSNTVSMIPTAEATIFKFAPTEAGTYIITGPEGSKVGIWGYSTNLNDPNSTSNSCELNLANTGPTVRVGVTGAEGDIVLIIEKQEEPTEPSVPESSEPETEPSEPSVPESSEPEVEPSEPVSGTVVLNEAVTAAVASRYVYTYKPAEDGTLTITVGDGSTTWSSDLVYFQGATMNTVATANGSAAATYSAEVTANTSYRVRVWNNSGALAATPLTVVFTPAGGTTPEPSEPETEPTEPSVPDTEPTEPSEPETEPSEPEVSEGVIFSGTDVVASPTAPVTHTWTAQANGTLTVTMSGTPGWKYTILQSNGETLGLPKSSSNGAEKSATFDVVAGETYTLTATGFNSNWDEAQGTISYTMTFTPEEGSGETVKEEYLVSDTALQLGDNVLTLLDSAVTTIYVFEPTETAVYTFTAPEGAILGYWGAGSWFLSNPNSTTNTYEWTCTGVGQSAYIGVSGVNGEFTLTVAKTGEYEVVETPIVKYENKAELNAFTVPEGATLGAYVDVFGDTHTAVLGDDGYYHLDRVDGPILLIDMDYMDIILSAALKSDRPVMYAYMTDEDGNTFKYDIGDAVLEYEAVMDANGYYPVTEDILLFYQVYAVQAGTFTFYVSGDYNEDCVWMYCMRTMTLPEPAVAQVGNTQYATLAEAIAAANGNTVVLLADCAGVTVNADVTIDLAGFSLTGVTVAEGATLYLADSATDDYEGAYGTAEVTGNVASRVTVNGKNYLVVKEDGKYSAHCYALEITHISLKPADDALGYKAKLYGDAVVQSKVTGFGFNMGVALQKTVEKSGAPVNGEFTLRLKGIMAVNGGDMEITASAFVRFGDDMQTTEETKTTMKDTIKAVNDMELDDVQKAAVYALYAKYETVMAGWFTAEETNNIATWAPQSSEAVPAE